MIIILYTTNSRYLGSYISSICPRVGETLDFNNAKYTVVNVIHNINGVIGHMQVDTPQSEIHLHVTES